MSRGRKLDDPPKIKRRPRSNTLTMKTPISNFLIKEMKPTTPTKIIKRSRSVDYIDLSAAVLTSQLKNKLENMITYFLKNTEILFFVTPYESNDIMFKVEFTTRNRTDSEELLEKYSQSNFAKMYTRIDDVEIPTIEEASLSLVLVIDNKDKFLLWSESFERSESMLFRKTLNESRSEWMQKSIGKMIQKVAIEYGVPSVSVVNVRVTSYDKMRFTALLQAPTNTKLENFRNIYRTSTYNNQYVKLTKGHRDALMNDEIMMWVMPINVIVIDRVKLYDWMKSEDHNWSDVRATKITIPGSKKDGRLSNSVIVALETSDEKSVGLLSNEISKRAEIEITKTTVFLNDKTKLNSGRETLTSILQKGNHEGNIMTNIDEISPPHLTAKGAVSALKTPWALYDVDSSRLLHIKQDHPSANRTDVLRFVSSGADHPRQMVYAPNILVSAGKDPIVPTAGFMSEDDTSILSLTEGQERARNLDDTMASGFVGGSQSMSSSDKNDAHQTVYQADITAAIGVLSEERSVHLENLISIMGGLQAVRSSLDNTPTSGADGLVSSEVVQFVKQTMVLEEEEEEEGESIQRPAKGTFPSLLSRIIKLRLDRILETRSIQMKFDKMWEDQYIQWENELVKGLEISSRTHSTVNMETILTYAKCEDLLLQMRVVELHIKTIDQKIGKLQNAYYKTTMMLEASQFVHNHLMFHANPATPIETWEDNMVDFINIGDSLSNEIAISNIAKTALMLYSAFSASEKATIDGYLASKEIVLSVGRDVKEFMMGMEDNVESFFNGMMKEYGDNEFFILLRDVRHVTSNIASMSAIAIGKLVHALKMDHYLSMAWKSVMRIASSAWEVSTSSAKSSVRFSKDFLVRLASYSNNASHSTLLAPITTEYEKVFAKDFFVIHNYLSGENLRLEKVQMISKELATMGYFPNTPIKDITSIILDVLHGNSQSIRDDVRKIIIEKKPSIIDQYWKGMWVDYLYRVVEELSSNKPLIEAFPFTSARESRNNKSIGDIADNASIELKTVHTFMTHLMDLTTKQSPTPGNKDVVFHIENFAKAITTIISSIVLMRGMQSQAANESLNKSTEFLQKRLFYLLQVVRNHLAPAYSLILESFGDVTSYYAQKVAENLSRRTKYLCGENSICNLEHHNLDEYYMIDDMNANDVISESLRAMQIIMRALVVAVHRSCEIFGIVFAENVRKVWRSNVSQTIHKKTTTLIEFDKFMLGTKTIAKLFEDSMRAVSEPRKERISVTEVEFPVEIFTSDANITIFERAKVTLHELRNLDVTRFVVPDISLWMEMANVASQISYVNYDVSHHVMFGQSASAGSSPITWTNDTDSRLIPSDVTSYARTNRLLMQLRLVSSLLDPSRRIMSNVSFAFEVSLKTRSQYDKYLGDITEIVHDRVVNAINKLTNFTKFVAKNTSNYRDTISIMQDKFALLENIEQRMSKLHAVARNTPLHSFASLSLFFNAILYIARTEPDWFAAVPFMAKSFPRYRLVVPPFRMKNRLWFPTGANMKILHDSVAMLEEMIALSATKIYGRHPDLASDYIEELRVFVHSILTMYNRGSKHPEYVIVHIIGIAYFILLHIRQSAFQDPKRHVRGCVVCKDKDRISRGAVSRMSGGTPGIGVIMEYYSFGGRVHRLSEAETNTPGLYNDGDIESIGNGVKRVLRYFVELYVNDIEEGKEFGEEGSPFADVRGDPHVKLLLHLYLSTRN